MIGRDAHVDGDAPPGVKTNHNEFPIPDMMRAWVLGNPGELAMSEKKTPVPKKAEVLVRIDAAANGGGVLIIVDDDGPGLEPAMWEAVLQRGVRADEAAPGSGFGLAIVRDLAELYGGTIALGAAPMGGVRARLHLPGG